MLETSKDVFWLVLSLVVLLSGLGLAWVILYVALIMRDAKKITKSIRKKLDLVDQILETVKKKVETSAAYLPPLIEGMGKLASHFREKQKSAARRKSRKK